MAIIKALLKGGDCKNMNNYRLLFLLIHFSKIFHKIIVVRLITFLGGNKLLPKHQYIFKVGLGTEHLFMYDL